MTTPLINAWQTDPGFGSEPDGGSLIKLAAPDISSLTVNIEDVEKPDPKIYSLKTDGFFYWNLASALHRGAAFWGSQLSEIIWQTGETLPVHMDKGLDLASKYSRKGLFFYHAEINDRVIRSCESPNLVWHEMGHAVLDSIKPGLWDFPGFEADAFHEAFGDISSILCGLQSDGLISAVLSETNMKLYSSSRLSRFASQLGWAKRQIKSTEPEADCLRNAVNPFFYQNPLCLPANGPSTMLSSKPHSLSRVFTGAFLEGLANMFKLIANNNKEKSLQQASIDITGIFIESIKTVALVADLFKAVASDMIHYAGIKFPGINYKQALGSAFIRRGIISPADYVSILNKPLDAEQIAGADATELMTEAVPVAEYGLGVDKIFVYSRHKRRAAGITRGGIVGGVPESLPTNKEAKAFLENLIIRGQLKINDDINDLNNNILPSRPNISSKELSHTHELQKEGDGYVLKRMYID